MALSNILAVLAHMDADVEISPEDLASVHKNMRPGLRCDRDQGVAQLGKLRLIEAQIQPGLVVFRHPQTSEAMARVEVP